MRGWHHQKIGSTVYTFKRKRHTFTYTWLVTSCGCVNNDCTLLDIDKFPQTLLLQSKKLGWMVKSAEHQILTLFVLLCFFTMILP